MSQQLISTGGSPNDGTGDSIRVSFTKTNENFTELYSRIRDTVPSTNIGAVDDVAGTIAYDADYIYICFADYDGSSVIWGRISSTWV